MGAGRDGQRRRRRTLSAWIGHGPAPLPPTRRGSQQGGRDPPAATAGSASLRTPPMPRPRVAVPCVGGRVGEARDLGQSRRAAACRRPTASTIVRSAVSCAAPAACGGAGPAARNARPAFGDARTKGLPSPPPGRSPQALRPNRKAITPSRRESSGYPAERSSAARPSGMTSSAQPVQDRRRCHRGATAPRGG